MIKLITKCVCKNQPTLITTLPFMDNWLDIEKETNYQ